MTYFAQVFEKHNQIHNISKMAKSMSIDRTLLQKIIQGTRKFSNEESVYAFSQSLTLSPSATEELINAYRIDKIGLSNYNRRNLVKKLVEFPDKYTNISDFSTTTSIDCDLSKFPETSVINGINNVKAAMRLIVAAEQQREDANLSISAPPEVSCLQELIPIMVSSTPHLKITHIFPMLTLPNDNDENTYNLSCINNIFALFYTGCTYSPMVYYTKELLHHGFLPCSMLSHGCVIQFTEDLSQAIVSLKTDVVSMHHNFFEAQLKNSFPLTKTLPDIFTYFEAYTGFDRGIFDIQYLSAAPCFGLFLYEDLLEDVAFPDIPGREMMIEHCVTRNKKFQSPMNPIQYSTYFSEEGVDKFIETGRVSEVPDSCYKPLNDEQKYNLIHCIYEKMKEDDNSSAIIDPKKFHIPDNFGIAIYNKARTEFVLRIQEYFLAVDLNEPSVTYAFRDFLDNIPNTDFLLSKEESLKILEKKLKLLKH